MVLKVARSQPFRPRGLGVVSSAIFCAALLVTAAACSDSEPSTPGPQMTMPPVTAPGMAGAGSIVGGSGAAPVGPMGGSSTTPPVGNTTAPPATAGSGAPPIAGEGGPMMNPDVPGMPAAGSVDWMMMGYDVGSTYYNAAETKITKETAANLEVAYKVDMGGNVYSVPLQVGDKMYVAGPSSLRALNAADGKELWNVPLMSTASIAFDNGTIYSNGYNANVTAFSAADGKQLWSKKGHATQTADGSSSPIVAGDVVLVGGSSGSIELGVGSFRGYLTAMNKMTGDIVWSEFTVPEGSLGASIWSTASADVAAGVAFAGTGNNYGPPATDTSDAIIAFDLKTGKIKWKNQRIKNDTFGFTRGGSGPDSDFGANPVLYEAMVGGAMTKLVSAGAKGGTIHALRRDDGMEVWTRSICTGSADGSSGIFVNSTWSGKNMIFACNGGGSSTLYGFDGGTGEMAWMRKLTGPVWGRISAVKGVAFVGVGATLEVVDSDTGAMIKTFPSMGGTVAGTISVSNGRVAFGEGFTWSGGKAGKHITVLKVP
jgi:outer membrane protein assembly factor BamB